MFHQNVSAMQHRDRRRLRASCAVAVVLGGALVNVVLLDRCAAAREDDSPQKKADRLASEKDTSGRDVERKLLADLETARGAAAEQFDYPQFDRDMTAAFRAFGLDLDQAEPKEAGARLAGRPSTPEVAAALDEWCHVRQTRLRGSAWRRLSEVARAADPDPWRNALRDQLVRPTAETRQALRALAADAKALERQPVDSLVLLSRMLSNAGDRPAADSVLAVAAKRFPRDFWVSYEHGQLQITGAPRADPDEAVRSFTTALALRPKSARAQRGLDKARRLQGEVQLTRGYAQELQGNAEGAVSSYRDAIRLDSTNVRAHNGLASALFRRGKLDEAIATYRESIRIQPDDAEVRIYLASILIRQGKFDAAIDSYRAALRIRPDDADTHSGLGVALAEQKKFDEAIASLSDAIRLKPDDVLARLNLGYILAGQGKVDDAVAMFREAVRLKPGDSQTHFYLGGGLARLGKDDEAVAEYREAIRLKPGDPLAQFGLGYCLLRSDKPDEAITALREAVRLKPDHADAHFNLGYAFHDQGKLDEAIAAYREAIRHKPDFADAYFNLGSALQEMGEVDKAEDAYREARRLKPELDGILQD
jgi:Flp pilus assembly protein TadD